MILPIWMRFTFLKQICKSVVFFCNVTCLNSCYGLVLFFRYLSNHLMNLFAGAWEPRDVSPLPVDIPYATDEQVRQLLLIHNCLLIQSLTQTDFFCLLCFVKTCECNKGPKLHWTSQSGKETCNPAGKPSNSTPDTSQWHQVRYSAFRIPVTVHLHANAVGLTFILVHLQIGRLWRNLAFPAFLVACHVACWAKTVPFISDRTEETLWRKQTWCF